jgi:hypothetical protein
VSHEAVQTSHGTLDVAVASQSAIVVATDSRSRGRSGITDDTKKLFLLPFHRVVAIAGLGRAAIREFPELTAQIPALLAWSIANHADWDSLTLEDQPLPPGWPEDLAELRAADRYGWWTALKGPIQTIAAIEATFDGGVRSGLEVRAIVAGYRANGDAKIEVLRVEAGQGLSSWRRPTAGVHASAETIQMVDGFAFATIGVTRLADAILAGQVPQEFASDVGRFSGIDRYLEMRGSGIERHMSAEELTALAHDLIRATAERHESVGSEPLQTAVMRPGHPVVYEQPIQTAGDIVLPADGAWYMGVDFTPDFPFENVSMPGTVFTACRVQRNRSPIPIDGNWFFGSEFIDALFRYSGGRIGIGSNNVLTNCELRLSAPVSTASVARLHDLFERVTVA